MTEKQPSDPQTREIQTEKSQNATQMWSKYNTINHSYLYISVNSVVEKYNYKNFIMTFWNEILPKLINTSSVNEPEAQFVTGEQCWKRHVVVWVLTVLVIMLAYILASVFIAYYASQKKARKMKIIYTTSPEARKCLA